MIYLDYSATTPVNNEVLDTFTKATITFQGNPNSLHKLGLESKKLIDASTKQIAKLLNIHENEIIYTSGATESNNTAIEGVLSRYSSRGKHIITTKLEHSSILETLKYFEKLGYKVSYVKLDENGQVDLDDLKQLITDETVLVTIASVNSETGIKQDLNKIKKVLLPHKKIIFHSDVTQSIGKEKIDLSPVDLASFSAQKFYGLKGIGLLIKKEHLEIDPLIKGGKSTTIYRSGTPSPALIASMAKALRLALDNIDEKYSKVENLNKYLVRELQKIKEVHINSNNYSIPHIINISIEKIKPETMLHALEQNNIYISTKTACSKSGTVSEAVYELTKNMDYATHSLRISLSYLTTKEELDIFIKVLKDQIIKLKVLN